MATAVSKPPGSPQARKAGLGRRRTVMALVFTLPAIVAFVLFKYYPMVQAVYMSFFDYKVTSPPGIFVGLDNYTHAFRDPLNSLVWSNNIILFAWGLILGFWVPGRPGHAVERDAAGEDVLPGGLFAAVHRSSGGSRRDLEMDL